MRYWAGVALVVTTLIGLRHTSIACEDPGPQTFKDTRRLRDGDAHGLFTRQHLEAPSYDTTAYTEQRVTRHGDIDYRCDGYCTFGKPQYEYSVRVPVGERHGTHVCNGTLYICKRGRPSRCRKLARLGSTTTTTVFDYSVCPTSTTIKQGCGAGSFGICGNGADCVETAPGSFECQGPARCGAVNHYCGGSCPAGQKCRERPIPSPRCYPIGCECQ
jgi:hypothetical protein